MKNIRVIVCDDFFLPLAKIGVIYSVGLNQLKNICEAEVIEKSFLNKTSKKAAKNLGTDIDFNIYDEFSEAAAIVSSEQVPDILKIILDNKPAAENLQSIKNKIKIKYRLSDYFETNLINNEIYAGVDPRYIFNESILDNLTEKDLKIFLENKYNKACKAIIICGKIDTKKLIEKLNLKLDCPAETSKAATVNDSEKLDCPAETNKPATANDSEKNANGNNSDKNTVTVDANEKIAKTDAPQDSPRQIIEARSKFFGRSLYYMYRLNNSEFSEKRNVIFSILNHEIFNYLKKYSQLIDGFFITNSQKSDFFLIGFKLKRDTSKKSFESGLKNLFSHFKKTKFSQEKLESISKLKKFSEINTNEDIYAKYRMIRNRHILHLQTQKNTSEEILELSSDAITNFAKSILENGFVAKISTQYKAEN